MDKPELRSRTRHLRRHLRRHHHHQDRAAPTAIIVEIKRRAWQPSLNISTVLTSIGLLLSEPNPDDGLMHDAVEAKELNLPKSEVPDHFVNQKGLCGLSRKLSLESAGRTQRHNGETVSEVPIDHILNKHMEVRKQTMVELPIECNMNQDKVQPSTKKLSSEIVSPSKVRNCEKKDWIIWHKLNVLPVWNP
ncbi:hypothetical protein RND71_012201 [Anisodus tanguticus]|uniref:Uncharacterized protein n=1 Tax=Anisodus tanguticus TaxID=243964 RepID=A0AAE1VPJ8_9SOLA|nr:hypothetical protein RND71_012201 [Anisodus tanguticus]